MTSRAARFGYVNRVACCEPVERKIVARVGELGPGLARARRLAVRRKGAMPRRSRRELRVSSSNTGRMPLRNRRSNSSRSSSTLGMPFTTRGCVRLLRRGPSGPTAQARLVGVDDAIGVDVRAGVHGPLLADADALAGAVAVRRVVHPARQIRARPGRSPRRSCRWGRARARRDPWVSCACGRAESFRGRVCCP